MNISHRKGGTLPSDFNPLTRYCLPRAQCFGEHTGQLFSLAEPSRSVVMPFGGISAIPQGYRYLHAVQS